MPAERLHAPRDGFILYAVLSVTALLSVLFLSVSMLTRSAVETASVATADLAADALIQSGMDLAGYQLFVAKSPLPSLNGQQIRLDGGTITILAAPQGGKVDLNGAQPPLLEALYRASGLRALPPAVFAARVVDWRDTDDEAGKDGAEVADYRAAGASFGPRNGGFRNVGDLRWVLGVSEADAKILAALATVDNPDGRLDASTAPLELLAALPGMKPETVEQVVALRTSPPSGQDEALRALLAEQAALFSFDRPAAYAVAIEAQPADGGRTTRVEAVLIASATPTRAYQVVDWRR